jgi:hypothetical protein
MANSLGLCLRPTCWSAGCVVCCAILGERATNLTRDVALHKKNVVSVRSSARGVEFRHHCGDIHRSYMD